MLLTFFWLLLTVDAVEVYLDTHTHCKPPKSAYPQLYHDEQDPRELWTCEEAIKWHKTAGYNAMIITNHFEWEYLSLELIHQLEKNTTDFAILPGREFATDAYHMTWYFDPKNYNPQALPLKPNTYWCPTLKETTDLIQEVHQWGALTCIAHPHLTDSNCKPKLNWTMWSNLQLDAVEQVSSGIFDYYNQKGVAQAQLKVTAGTDGHSPLKAIPYGYTRLQVDQLNSQAIFEELRKGHYWVDYSPPPSGSYYWWPFYVLASIASVAVACMLWCGSYLCCQIRKMNNEMKQRQLLR